MSVRKPFVVSLLAALVLAGAAYAAAYTADIQGGTQAKQTSNTSPGVCADLLGTTSYQACLFGGLASVGYNPLVQANDSALIYNGGAINTGCLFVGPHSGSGIGWRSCASGLNGFFNTARFTLTNNTSSLPLSTLGAGVWAMNSGTGGTSFVAADSSGNAQTSLVWDGSLSHLTQNSTTAFTWNTSYAESVLNFGAGVVPGGSYRFETGDTTSGGDAIGRIGQTFPLILRGNFPTLGFNSANISATEKYVTSNYAGSLEFDSSGSLNFYNAPSGTAGGTITRTNRMSIPQSGIMSLPNGLLIGATNSVSFGAATSAEIHWDGTGLELNKTSSSSGYVIMEGNSAGTDTMYIRPNSTATIAQFRISTSNSTWGGPNPSSGQIQSNLDINTPGFPSGSTAGNDYAMGGLTYAVGNTVHMNNRVHFNTTGNVGWVGASYGWCTDVDASEGAGGCMWFSSAGVGFGATMYVPTHAQFEFAGTGYFGNLFTVNNGLTVNNSAITANAGIASLGPTTSLFNTNVTVTTVNSTARAGYTNHSSRNIIRNSVAVSDCAGSTLTATVANILDNAIFINSSGTGCTVTLPTWQGAGGTVQALPPTPQIGDVIEFKISAQSGTILLSPGTGGTFLGSTTMAVGTRNIIWCRLTNVTSGTETATCY